MLLCLAQMSLSLLVQYIKRQKDIQTEAKSIAKTHNTLAAGRNILGFVQAVQWHTHTQAKEESTVLTHNHTHNHTHTTHTHTHTHTHTDTHTQRLKKTAQHWLTMLGAVILVSVGAVHWETDRLGHCQTDKHTQTGRRRKHSTDSQLLSCLVQSSLSELEQYMGRWPMVMIQGRLALFSGLDASCRHRPQQSHSGL